MTKKNIIIISVVSTLILLLILFWFFRGGNNGDSLINIDSGDIFSDLNGENKGLSDSSEGFNGVTGDQGSQNTNINNTVPTLRKINFKETSGFGLFDDQGTTTIRFISTESGNVFETNSKSLDIKRVTNTTILQTIDSLWVDEDTPIIRYIDENGDLQSFYAKIEFRKDESLGSLSGEFLDKNIKQIDVLDGKTFVLIENSSNSTGVLYNKSVSSGLTILNTPLKEILSSFVNKNTILINTKPSSKSPGYSFILKTDGSFTEILSGITGLTTNMAPNGNALLYSVSGTRGVSLWFLDRKTGVSKKVQKDTLPEKCVWANAEEYIVYCAVPQNIRVRDLPDDWYKGNISFTDDLWRINLETDEAKLIISPEESIDAIQIKISENGNYIVFVNKKDMTLWGINLIEN